MYKLNKELTGKYTAETFPKDIDTPCLLVPGTLDDLVPNAVHIISCPHGAVYKTILKAAHAAWAKTPNHGLLIVSPSDYSIVKELGDGEEDNS